MLYCRYHKKKKKWKCQLLLPMYKPLSLDIVLTWVSLLDAMLHLYMCDQEQEPAGEWVSRMCRRQHVTEIMMWTSLCFLHNMFRITDEAYCFEYCVEYLYISTITERKWRAAYRSVERRFSPCSLTCTAATNAPKYLLTHSNIVFSHATITEYL